MNRKYLIRVCYLAAMLLLFPVVQGQAQNVRENRYKAIAFDYLVVFDPNSHEPAAEAIFPGKGQEIVKHWRGKQKENNKQRTKTKNNKDFSTITGDALD